MHRAERAVGMGEALKWERDRRMEIERQHGLLKGKARRWNKNRRELARRMVELRGQIDRPWERVEMVRMAEELHGKWREMEGQAELWYGKYQGLKGVAKVAEVEEDLWVGEVVEMEDQMEGMQEEWWEEEDRLWAQAEVLALELQGMEKEVEDLKQRQDEQPCS